MAYRIVYSVDRRKVADLGKLWRVQVMTALFLAGTLAGVLQFWEEAAVFARQVFSCGAAELALTDVAAAWTAGQGLYGALAAFCRTVIYGAV